MKGLYIMTSPALQEYEECGLGMSEQLESRIYDYNFIFDNPYYYACYEFANYYNKMEIYYIKQVVLEKTKLYWTNNRFSSEFRKMKPEELDKIVKETLEQYNIVYTYHNPVTFKIVKKTSKNTDKKSKYCFPNRLIGKYNSANDIITLNNHQKNCINSISNILSLKQKCYINTPHESEKSIISFVQLCNYKFSVVVFPNLLLIEQFYHNYLKNSNYRNYTDQYEILCLCSNKLIGGTTDTNLISQFIKKNNNKILLVTYMSLNILYNCFNCVNIYPNLMIFDECHYTTNKLHDTKFLYLFTTTPNNDFNYGELAYKFKHKDTVNVCKKFDVIIDLYTVLTKESIYNSIAKNSISTGNHKIITYHNSVTGKNNMSVTDLFNEKNTLIKMINDTFNKEFDTSINNINIDVTSGKNKNKRNSIKKFEESSNDDFLMSCMSVSENVDIKSANCICFCELKNDEFDIAENINRITKNIKQDNNYNVPTIIIPMASSKQSNYDTLYKIIDSLKDSSNIIICNKGIYKKTIDINNLNNNTKYLDDTYNDMILSNNTKLLEKSINITIENNTNDKHVVINNNNFADFKKEIGKCSDDINTDDIIKYFLTRFPNLSTKIISESYIIAKKEYMDNEFVMDIEQVSAWVGTLKGNLKKILQTNFEINVDYIANKKYIKRKVGSTMKEDIFITINCFKELCTIYHPKKSKEVKKYYVEMEKFIKRYQGIIKNIN